MTTEDLILGAILYLFIPLWLLAGLGDWLCHRATRISETAGTGESLLHLLMIAEIGVPMLMGLFLEINALVLAIMILAFLAHEATVLWDLRYAGKRREIIPVEQMIHSYQEVIPLVLLVLLAFLHRDQFLALLTLGDAADYRLAWKREPLPSATLASLMAASALAVGLPFLEEWWRCRHAERLRAQRGA